MKTKKILIILIASIIISSYGAIGLKSTNFNNNTIGSIYYPTDTWHNETVYKTGYHAVQENIISYDEKIIYADEIIYKDEKPQPLKLDLILRSIDDVNLPETQKIYATILNINGELRRYDLDEIKIESLEKYHGKLFVGIKAYDPYINVNPLHIDSKGTNDQYRRRVYVTSSVEEGFLISNPYYNSFLGGQKTINIEYIEPTVPHLFGTPGLDSPTSCNFQIRTAESLEELYESSWSEYHDDYSIINIPINHHYFQYKINMQTEDTKLTPIVKKIELSKSNGEVIFSDNSWDSSNNYQNINGINGTLSKGELVLDNLLIETEEGFQVHFSYLFQAPSNQEPPEWSYNVKQFFRDNMPRNFDRSCWPYPGVVSMEVFQQKLYMNVGCHIDECHSMTAGEFVSYDYDSGIIKTEANQYSDKEFDWWNEGNGRLRVVGNILTNNGIDTKSLGSDIIEDPEVPGGCQIYQFTDGSGEWYVGITPSAGVFKAHLWDMEEYNGLLFISRNNGTYYRDMPTDISDHNNADSYNPNNWILLEETAHHQGDPGTLGNSQHNFIKFGNYFVIYYTDAWKENGQSNRIKKMYTFDGNLNVLTEINMSSFLFGQDKNTFGCDGNIIYKGRILIWNLRSGRVIDSSGFGHQNETPSSNEINLKPYDPEVQAFWASRFYYTDSLS